MTRPTVRLATRTSPLALIQTNLVADALRAAHPDLVVEVVPGSTIGDRVRELPLDALRGRGVFTSEIDALVSSRAADAAVHSAKDLPSTEVEGALVIGAVLARGEVRDALVGGTLEGLAAGAPIATGAPRRRVQLSAIRPDLVFVPLRGNIGTRLERVPTGGAAIVALAALERLGIAARVSEILPVASCLPQVGQGVIAVRCDRENTGMIAMLESIDDKATHRCLDAERAFLSRLGGGCDAPVGAFATTDGPRATLHLEAMIASGDGHLVLRRAMTGDAPEVVGRDLAESMLDENGASAVIGAWS